jgi:hypothetical protein
VQNLSEQALAERYVEELLKLKCLHRFGRGSQEFRGYPNVLLMKLCKRELECRGVPVPLVHIPPEEKP